LPYPSSALCGAHRFAGALRGRSRGGDVPFEEYRQRFPHCAERICHLWLTGADGPPPAPTSDPPQPKAPPGYEILEEVGRGGMGVVYKARHLGLKRVVALKMILSAEHAGEDVRSRFRAEAEAIARLQHPNIVQVYDLGEEQGKPYFALETDVYALGALLYESLTGRPPFRGASVLDTLELVRSQEPVAPGRLVPRLPRDLETICLKCLEKEPARRYAGAAALAEDLRRYLENRPIQARPVGRWEQLRKFARRNKVLVGSSIAVTLALVLAVIGTSLGMARARRAEGVALKNLGRALEAEKETRRELARSHWDNARMAAGHGRWREAIALYDRALEAGFEDDIAVRLEKLKALLALHENKLAEQEMAALGGRADLGSRQSVLLLLRGDLALGQWSGKEQALADVRRALEQGLPPEDEAYAQALLADWPRDAVGHLRRALKLNPAHPDARQLLLPLLMTLGRFEEGKEEAHTLLAFFPEDPSPRIFLAFLHLLEGDAKAAAARIRETEAQLGKERVAVLLEVVAVLHTAFEAAMASDQPQVSPFLVWRLTALMNEFRQVDAQGPTAVDFHSVNMPALARVWKPLYAALTASFLTGSPDELAAQLEEVVTHHPEGVAYFLHATANVARATRQKGAAMLPFLRKAESSFRRAADGPCTIPAFRRLARFWGTYSQAILANPDPKRAPPDPEMRARALGNMRRLLADGGLSPDWWANLTELALTRLEDHDLARLLAAAGERQAPKDIRFVRWRAQIELAAGAHRRALEAADKVLARMPKDSDALRVRKEALDRLREPPPPPSPP
jgi:tetratricopeptide (TPR) repeat protein